MFIIVITPNFILKNHKNRLQLSNLKDSTNKSLAALICEICNDENRTHVMVPCGHTLCGSCGQNLTRSM